MNGIPQLASSPFAIAGFLCAAVPVLIHLWNRRRHQSVDWAAMDLLREAVRRRQRRWQLRDLILLLLRTAAVCGFGLALARPYFSSSGMPLDAHSPRHLILLLDNSLSMDYRAVDVTALEVAKQRAEELIDALPGGSQITVAGTCGERTGATGPTRSRAEARRRLASLVTVDAVARVEDVMRQIHSVRGTAASLPDQVVYFTDLQRGGWPERLDAQLVANLPPLRIHDLSASQWTNTWVVDVRLQDEVIEQNTATAVFATIGYHGGGPRRVQVSLSVQDQVISTKSLDLPTGSTRQQVVFECTLTDQAVSSQDVTFVPLVVSVTPDRLALDDSRTVIMPVVASLPVLFVDQYGAGEEQPGLGKLGETRPLRRLLTPGKPRTQPADTATGRHVAWTDLERTQLAEARVVVVAGIADPSDKLNLLREYVEQGGRLLIAAGGTFDPRAWNAADAAAGAPLLPGRLLEHPVGFVPEELLDEPLVPFRLAPDAFMTDPLLRPPGLSDEQLGELVGEPLFFKAVALDMQTRTASPPVSSETMPQRASPSASWLAWHAPDLAIVDPLGTQPSEQRELDTTRVHARYTDTDHTPFVASRRLGKGQVVFVSSSVLPTWNNLAQTNAMLLWDHLVRGLLDQTLPRRNVTPSASLFVPLPSRDRATTVHLTRPGGVEVGETLDVDYGAGSSRGVTISDMWQRGRYRLSAAAVGPFASDAEEDAWHMEVSVQGEAGESDLTPLSSAEIQTKIVESGIGQILFDDAPHTLLASPPAGNLSGWLALGVLLLLIGELGVLSLTVARRA